MRRPRLLALALALAAVIPAAPRAADACGCVTPVQPPPDATGFAVNQQAEQIIFEMEPGFITAHVLIQYAGDPAAFAWLVPVPSVPELGLSPPEVFALLDASTGPQVSVVDEDICPRPSYQCAYHAPPQCGGDPWGGGGEPGGYQDASASSDAAGGGPGGSPVEIHTRTTVGDYEVVVFGTGSGDAREAVDWLQAEGFLVNDTMAEYMTPYVAEGDLFLAARLVPGAGAGAIKPLRMKFADDEPMIPLRLTAVAADPHMTITSYVYADGPVAAHGKATVAIQANDLGRDKTGRTNYPMVLARTIDRAGGDGYVTEFAGPPPAALDLDGRGCCAMGPFDACGIQYDGVCSCPGNLLDEVDCAAQPGLVEGATLMADLATRHPYMTRLTTRLSPEEMTTDPMFRRVERSAFEGRLTLTGVRESLDFCEESVMDRAAYRAVRDTEDCATVYCGKGGTCAVGGNGAGCACDPGTVARQFVDLDGQPSVTCVPERPQVDFEAGGLDLPDACVGVTCGGGGTCADLNGVAHCKCAAGEAAVVTVGGTTPSCHPVWTHADDAGGHNTVHGLNDLPVCAPPPPACGAEGWLVQTFTDRPGIDCGDATPTASALIPPPAPTCDDETIFQRAVGCGCRVGGTREDAGLGSVVLLGLAALVGGYRRRCRPRRRARS